MLRLRTVPARDLRVGWRAAYGRLVLATVPNPVVYEKAVYTVKVHCAPEATAPCTGDVWLHLAEKDIGPGPFQVAAGKTVKVRIKAGDARPGPGTSTIKVSFGVDGRTFERRLKADVPAPADPGGGPHTDYPITQVVRDRRGDGAGPLDLRKAEAHVRNHRLIMTWTCWGTVTPAKMDHDSANFDARVYTRKPHDVQQSRMHATVFYGDHGPVLFAGAEMGPNDWGGRFYRPNSHAVRMSMPLRRFGRRIKQLWIEPATVAYAGGEDTARATIHFRLRR